MAVFSLFFSCCNFEIFYTMTGFYIFQFIIQNIPLIRNNHILYQMHIFIPKIICNMNLFKRNT